MLAIHDFRLAVVRPVLMQLSLWSQAAENLLLGTAVQESGLRYLRQLGRGPALGVYQIEPATHDDVWTNFLAFRPALAESLSRLAAPVPDRRTQLVLNLAYATAMARLIYWRRPEPLPEADDVAGLARYWKAHFNTVLGRGTVAAFILNYKEHVE